MFPVFIIQHRSKPKYSLKEPKNPKYIIFLFYFYVLRSIYIYLNLNPTKKELFPLLYNILDISF